MKLICHYFEFVAINDAAKFSLFLFISSKGILRNVFEIVTSETLSCGILICISSIFNSVFLCSY